MMEHDNGSAGSDRRRHTSWQDSSVAIDVADQLFLLSKVGSSRSLMSRQDVVVFFVG